MLDQPGEDRKTRKRSAVIHLAVQVGDCWTQKAKSTILASTSAHDGMLMFSILLGIGCLISLSRLTVRLNCDIGVLIIGVR